MTSPTVQILPNPDALAEAAAERFIQLAGEAIAQRERFTVALAGGSTPERLYRLLARPENAARVDWARCHLFLGDERFVSPEDPSSNYGMARRTLLSAVPMAYAYPVPTQLSTPSEAAAAYARTLAELFGGSVVFDLILLGLGDDGHTLSLFPGKPAVTATEVVTWSPPGVLPPPVDRVTLTLPTANAARHALFLVAGVGKADIVPKVMDEGATYPASRIRPVSGALTWLLDADAARNLA